ncbi:DUF6583 family protein [Sporosarcina sp. JAI121]|uniref:DUF6583 family protein n=1 Tax=Sporosarcina sp. JAI121 TaxID=2723064 RepID=UPI0015CE7EBD|nr:DUF6583 family protein [Sporosarcina sp. JAI121]NYF25342.1 hypothetical protein [Sporosarcina sp. JAI121]
MEEKAVKKKSPRLLIVAVVTALVILGGSVSAFLLVNKSPKVQYFLAESGTVKQVWEIFDDRYKNELKWIETQQDKPVETNYDLSAEWNDPTVDYEMQEVQSILNSAKLSMKQVNDPVKKEMEVQFDGVLGSMKVDFGSYFATTEKLVASLPFMDELIRFDDKDFGKLMREIDPDYKGNENLGLSQLFEEGFSMTEESRTYIEKEYIKYLAQEIPEDAFTSEKEEITVFDNKLKTKKLEMTLTEKEVKALLKDLLEKAKTDEKLKSILKEQLTLSSIAGEASNNDIETIISDFEDGLDEAIKGVDKLTIPNGIRSTIWHHSNSIVKREFTISIGENKEETTTLTIGGTQLLEKTAQKWDYKVGVTDRFGDENVVQIKGDLTWKDKKADDSITLIMDDMKVIYKGKEELKDKKRSFTRSFGFTDGEMEPELVWKGSATHESDSMKANHEFMFSEDSIGENMISLLLKQQGKVVKKVEMPAEKDDTVNIGKMTMSEIEAFIENEITPKFQEWISGFMEELQGEIGAF